MMKMMVVDEGVLRRSKRGGGGGGVVMVVGWWILLLSLARTAFTYRIVTLEGNGGTCNDTVYVDGAVILRLTDQPSYSFTPLNCIITFTAPQFSWSGLTGVVEDVDLRKFEDKADHHMAQNQCVDFIKVVTDTGVPQEEQCGTWKVGIGQPLSPHLGYRRALVGYCSTPPDDRASELKCGVSTLKVQVSVGHKDNPIWRNTRWRQHRGFTFVVTSYRYQYRESECAAGLRSCSEGEGQHPYCIHSSLWCDDHINCGHPRHNLDETSCLHHEMLGGLVTVMAGPWMGAALLLLLVFGGLLYWRHAKFRWPNNHHAAAAAAAANNHHPAGQDMNSYAESYEVSSTLSTAPHMAIQVRVVCNPGQGNNSHHHNLHSWPGSTTTTTTTIDLPPAYDSLFPYGPPPPPPPPPAYPPSPAGGTPSISSPSTAVSTTTTPTTPSTTPAGTSPAATEGTAAAATATITTTSQLSLGVNNHNSASLSTTIVASADGLNAGASTSTAAEDGKNATTTSNRSAFAPISLPVLSSSPTQAYLPTFSDASVSTTTTTTIRGASPSNFRQPHTCHHQCKPEGIPVDTTMVAAKQTHYQHADLPEADMALHEELRTSQPQQEPEPLNDQRLPLQPQSPQNRSPNHQPPPQLPQNRSPNYQPPPQPPQNRSPNHQPPPQPPPSTQPP